MQLLSENNNEKSGNIVYNNSVKRSSMITDYSLTKFMYRTRVKEKERVREIGNLRNGKN